MTTAGTQQTLTIGEPVGIPAEVAASGLPTVLEIWAPWCGPCRAMAPGLDAASAEYAGKVALVRINADEEAARVEALGVRSIPTMILLRDGREVGRHVGVMNPSGLRDLFGRMAQGDEPLAAPTGMNASTRMVRALAAVTLALVGLVVGLSSVVGWFFLALGGVVFFSAIHDRCPLWQAVRRSLGMGAAPSP